MPAAALLLVTVPFAAVDMAMGDPVKVVVTDIAPDQCLVADLEDPSTVWEADCESGWTRGATVTTTIGGLTDEPTSWRRVGIATVGLILLLLPGAAVLAVGYALRRVSSGTASVSGRPVAVGDARRTAARALACR